MVALQKVVLFLAVVSCCILLGLQGSRGPKIDEGASYVLGGRAENLVYRNPLMSQLRATEVLDGCEFQSQGHHFIDMEMLYQLGGSVELPFHDPDSETAVYEAMAQCRSENLNGGSTAQSCRCAVPSALKFEPLSAPPVGGAKRPRYVEVGADDGRFLSNTFFFDKQLGWEGICVEPSPKTFAKLANNRPGCHNVNAVLSSNGPDTFEYISFDDSTWERQMSGILGSNAWTKTWEIAQARAEEQKTTVQKHNIPAVSFKSLFAKHGFDTIELMSVDVEGAELTVLNTIDFDAVDIHFIVVEANPPVKPFVDLLLSKGFVQMKRDKINGGRTFGYDQLLYRNTYDIWFVNENWSPK